MNMEHIYFPFPGNETLAKVLAHKTQSSLGSSEIRHFPDGETYVRIDSDVCAKRVVIVCTLNRPDEKLTALYFFSRIARSMNATGITLISPYLPYMRQDKRFKPGEGISACYFAEFLSSFVDELITIDPHLHRFHSLSTLYSVETRTLTATSLIGNWIMTQVTNPLIIGPDSESEQWVKRVADICKAPYTVLTKTRQGDQEVSIRLTDTLDLENKTPVLVDDIISTGRSMMETLRLLKAKSTNAPVCIAVHGLFAGDAYEQLKSAGAAQIITTNTVLHSSNQIDISPLLG